MIKKEHTRNQRRMYRIHKQDEKINAQELIIASLQQRVEQLENIRKEAIEYINKNILINYEKIGFKTDTVAGIVVDDLLNILNKGSESDGLQKDS